MSTAVIVLAAGKGTRMRSNRPKVLHEVARRSMLGHVVNAGFAAKPEKTVVVVSDEQVAKHVQEHFPVQVSCVWQKEQLGTAHAVLSTEEELKNITGNVLILCGDVPLLDAETIERFVTSHESQDNDIRWRMG